MKEKGKIVFNFLFFILLIFLTYYIIFRDYSIKTIISYLKDLNKIYLFIAFFLISSNHKSKSVKLLLSATSYTNIIP